MNLSTQNEIKGTAHEVKGKIKETAGKVTNNGSHRRKNFVNHT